MTDFSTQMQRGTARVWGERILTGPTPHFPGGPTPGVGRPGAGRCGAAGGNGLHGSGGSDAEGGGGGAYRVDGSSAGGHKPIPAAAPP